MRRLLGARGAAGDRGPSRRAGWLAGRAACPVEELLAELPGRTGPISTTTRNSAGYASLAAELAVQLDHLDVLVCSVGTGGHSAGIIGPLRRHWPRLRLIGVDATGSTIFGQPARPRLMRGLGSSIHPRNVHYDAFDEVHWVGPAEAVDSRRRLASRASSAAAGAPAPRPVSPPGRPASTRARSSRPSSPTVRTAISTPSTTTTSPPRTASTWPPRPPGPWRSRTRVLRRPPAGCAAPASPIPENRTARRRTP